MTKGTRKRGHEDLDSDQRSGTNKTKVATSGERMAGRQWADTLATQLDHIDVAAPEAQQREERQRFSVWDRRTNSRTVSMLLPFEGILLSLLLSHHQSSRHDVAMAIRFASGLIQGSLQACTIGFADRTRWNLLGRGGKIVPCRANPTAKKNARGRDTADADCDIVSLCLSGVLPPASYLRTRQTIRDAMFACVCGEQLDIYRVLCSSAPSLPRISAVSSDCLTKILNSSALFQEPQHRPKPAHPRLDVTYWIDHGVDFGSILRTAVAGADQIKDRCWGLTNVGNNAEILELLCGEPEVVVHLPLFATKVTSSCTPRPSWKVECSVLHHALHSLRSLKACFVLGSDKTLDDEAEVWYPTRKHFWEVMKYALWDPHVPLDVLDYLWNHYSHDFKQDTDVGQLLRWAEMSKQMSHLQWVHDTTTELKRGGQ